MALRKSVIKILIPAVLVLSIGIGIFAHPVWRNSFLKAVMSEKTYFKYVVSKNCSDLASDVSGIYEWVQNVMHSKNSANINVSLAAGEDEKSNIKKYTGAEIPQVFSGIDTLGVSLKTGKTTGIYGIGAKLSVNGEPFIDAAGVLTQNGLYTSVPKLNDKAVFVSAEHREYGEKIKEILNNLKNIEKILGQRKNIEDIAKKYFKLVCESISYADEETVILSAGGNKCKATRIKLELSGGKVLREIKDCTLCIMVDSRGRIIGLDVLCDNTEMKYYTVHNNKKRGVFFHCKSDDMIISCEGSDNKKSGTYVLEVMGTEFIKIKKEFDLKTGRAKTITLLPEDEFCTAIALFDKDAASIAQNISKMKLQIECDTGNKQNKKYTLTASAKEECLGSLMIECNLTRTIGYKPPVLFVDLENIAKMRQWQADTVENFLNTKEFAELFDLF